MNLKLFLRWSLMGLFFWSNHWGATAQQLTESSLAIGMDHRFEARGLMGGGAAFFDADQDGDEDVYLVSGTAKDAFYENNGDGTFSLVLTDIGLNVTIQYNTTAVITGDLDNDGDREIFITTWERYEGGNELIARNLLFNNNGDGTFTEIGVAAGIIHEAFAIGANFIDVDRDGLLDIYVINHVETPAFLYDTYGQIIGFDHDCYPNFLYKNNGDLTFTEVATNWGLDDLSCTLASIPTDFDQDGDLDLYLANDFGPFIVPNLMYENQYPDPQFAEISALNGSDIPMYGMGVAIGDYDQDQDFDYYITNLGSNVLLNNDEGIFTDVAATAAVENEFASGSEFATGWGTAFLDIDNDSWLDLFVVNGRIPSLPSLPTAFNDPDKLYLNNGDGTFTDVSEQVGIDDPDYGRGMAYSDFDLDGDLDVLVVNLNELGGRTKFYLNETTNDHHYLQVKLSGTLTNRDAFGSKLRLYAGGQTYLREITGGGASFCSQHSSIAHFGLGMTEQIDSLTIEWLSGQIEHLTDLRVDTLYHFEEGLTTSTVALAAENRQVDIYPNPFSENIHIQAAQINEEASLTLMNINNQLLFQRKILLSNDPQWLSMPSAIPPGIYYLRIQYSDQVIIKKMVKS